MLQLLVAGVAIGGVLALTAMGFVLVYRTTNVLSLAQIDMLTLAAVLLVWLTRDHGVPVLLAWAIAIAVCGVLGAVVYYAIYVPLSKRPDTFLTVAVATLGFSIALHGFLFAWWGPVESSAPSPVGIEPVRIAGAVFPKHMLLVIAVVAVLVTVQTIMFRRTVLGWQMRATAEDAEVARLLGVNTRRLVLGTFVYGSMLAGLAGVLIAPIYLTTLDLGTMVSFKAMIAAIVGGFGSVPGALAGGLLIGVAESLGAGYISTAFRDSFSFGLLLIILCFRPTGIVRVKAEEKV